MKGAEKGDSLETVRKPPNKPRKVGRVGMKGGTRGIWDSHGFIVCRLCAGSWTRLRVQDADSSCAESSGDRLDGAGERKGRKLQGGSEAPAWAAVWIVTLCF